ncbi:MAG: hypothetical protein HOI23_06235 [Deltaproteobacteria bacterium]|nr:hypothetical protein [Deltaproteobacteria bacterium]MBT6433980.1 hypothetical protein [Deltaproteobacteria bacterium]MBT6491685.1 hypothetical protein [Deltaproteobacteria bacterium]
MHTFVISDLHISDAEAVSQSRPYWKSYKRREMFFDDDFCRFLAFIEKEANGEPAELVLNGDIFDFDNIVQLPVDRSNVDWLAKLRGLGSQEWMSLFKMDCIIADHQQVFMRLGEFAKRGNKVVFVVGNHDMEMHWESVQNKIRTALGIVDTPADEDVRFCSWFYMSGEDTYISHGHQYDGYCSARNLIHPQIKLGGKPAIRIPFGDLCERYLLNGMGYFNPHATSNYIMSGLQYVLFFFKYMLRTQPMLLWTWFWSALATFVTSMRHFMAPPIKDPLEIENRVSAIATAAQVTPSVVRQLNALNAPSACSNPLRILRELWLDRALLFLGMFYFAGQITLAIQFIVPISFWWFLIPLTLFMPFYFVYSFNVNSTVFKTPLLTEKLASLISEITGCSRVVFGHNHQPEKSTVADTEYLNSGFWSPAYSDPQCTHRIGTQTFVWISPQENERRGSLWEWPPGQAEPLPFESPEGVL